MECPNCGKDEEGKPIVRSWTALPPIDVNDIPEDLDLICGSDKEMRSWRIPVSLLLEDLVLKINSLEKEIESLRKELKNGK